MTHSTAQGAAGNGALSGAAHERAVLAERLADPELLDEAVEIRLGEDGIGGTCLAVPVGGRRVAGRVSVAGWIQARQVLQALAGKPGFPYLRDDSHGNDIDDPCHIAWGLHTGIRDDHGRRTAQMLGYHPAGVNAYVTEQTWRDARVPVTPLPQRELSAPAGGRVYDLLLGGRDNYLADQRLIASLTEHDRQTLKTAAAINRAHQPAIVETLAARGIDQYLDLGCGHPLSDALPMDDAPSYTALHELVAQYRGPAARTVYVDHDTFIFGKVRHRLEDDPRRPQWVNADIRYMRQLLTSGRIQYLLDFHRPVAVLLHDVLPWIDNDETVAQAMAVLRERLAPGSALSITHTTDLGENNTMSRFINPYRAAGLAYTPRNAHTISTLFGNWPLEKPGLVPTHHWHPEHPHTTHPFHHAGALAALAYKPETRRA
ncbi:DUF6302 family protein [Streptomyces griseofuscus]|uniref:DUF6302 family protein n=1 Tax=Streptomyces griseofuscus TaxID=146922 RepID=UPI0038121101